MPLYDTQIKPGLVLLYQSYFDLDTPVVIGRTRQGLRRIVPITGGRFEGDRLRGKVLPGGADWQMIRPDGVAEIEARYTLETDDGALIYVVNKGLVHNSAEAVGLAAEGFTLKENQYYFRTQPRFETGHESYAWLTKLMTVGVGEVGQNRVHITVYTVT